MFLPASPQPTRLSPRQLSRTIRLRFSCARPGRDIRHQQLRYHVVTTVNCAEDAIHRKVDRTQTQTLAPKRRSPRESRKKPRRSRWQSSALRQLKTCVRVHRKGGQAVLQCLFFGARSSSTSDKACRSVHTTNTPFLSHLAAHRPPGLVGVVDDSECDMAR